MADRIRCFGYSYWKIEANITFFFHIEIINLSFNGLAYNTCEHFAHCERHSHRRNQDVCEYSYQKIEAICKIIFFCSGIINLLFDGLAYNTSGHFAYCSYFSSPLRGSEKYYATRKISARIIC